MRALAVIRTLAVVVLVLGCVPSAWAQFVISQWNYNGVTNASYSGASAGLVTGTAALSRNFATMNAASAPLKSQVVNGVASDPGTVVTNTTAPIGTYTYNNSFTTSLPSVAVANKSAGSAFTVPTTAAVAGQPLQLSWSQAVGWRASRYYQVLTSTSGTAGPFLPVSGGVGSSVSQAVTGYNSGTSPISGTATVTVSNDGIIDFRTIENNWINLSVSSTGANVYSPFVPASFAAGYVNDITFTLPAGRGFEGNPNFAFAIVGIWDPSNPSATSGTTGLVSSFAGTDSLNGTTGYVTSGASGGQARFDLVTVSIVPEPSSVAMLGVAVATGGVVTWRRRRTRRCQAA